MRPYLHSAAAALYIVGVVFLMTAMAPQGRSAAGAGAGAGGVMLPVAVLSLLVLSVALMGFLLGFEPIRLFVDGRRAEAVTFFWKTLLSFAGIAAMFVATYFLFLR